MDTADTLLIYLKKKNYINDIEKAKSEVRTEKIHLRKGTDLFIRDAITGMGTILKEDLDKHYYITTVKEGVFGNVLAQAIIMRNGGEAEIAAYAKARLLKQDLADKAVDKLRKSLS